MYCMKCGNQIPDNAKFCPKCGNVIMKKNWNINPRIVIMFAFLATVCIIGALIFRGNDFPTSDSNTQYSQNKIENTENAVTDSESAIENEPQEPEIAPMTIPDPCMFLGCEKNDSHETNDGEAWMVGCTFSIDGAKDALNELMALYTSGEYPLQLTETVEEDFVNTSAQYFYYFYFDYTGNEPEVEGFEYFTGIHTDVVLQVVFNYASGTVDLRMRHDNTLTLVDSQKQATVLPESYSGTYNPNISNDSTSNDYYKPDHSKLDCVFCDDGKCPKCNGYGEIERYSGKGETITSMCPDCRRSGKCKQCNGTGNRED